MIVMNGIDAVFFDADETIFHVMPSVTHYYSEVLKRFGYQIEPTELEKALLSSWREIKPFYENAPHRYVTFPMRERELWREYSRRVVIKIGVPPALELLDTLYERFADGSTRTLSPHFCELLATLKSRGIFTGIFTNNDDRIHRVVDFHQLRAQLDFVFCSGEIGFKKPSPSVFHEIESRTGIIGPRNLYVGNSIEHDYLGPVTAGWQAIVFATSESVKTETSSRNIPSVLSFEELDVLFRDL